jgi:N-dimethylarginine dimethylaminohydrolase
MTVPLLEVAASSRGFPERASRRRRYLMCPPRYFDVSYSINPWMDWSVPVDPARATAQWEHLVETYENLGHDVEIIEPVAGVPDMVFSANSAIVDGGRVLTARFRHPERAPEQLPYRQWFLQREFTEVRAARAICEGEGDVTFVGAVALAGWGFRTSRGAHHELQEFFGRPVVSLRLCDPRFYHLDMALCIVDERTVAYFPPAFSAGSRCVLQRLFPDAIRVQEPDAYALGLNAVCDGHHVVLPVEARGMADLVRARGFDPVPVEMSEFVKAGGGVKCCTLELR